MSNLFWRFAARVLSPLLALSLAHASTLPPINLFGRIPNTYAVIRACVLGDSETNGSSDHNFNVAGANTYWAILQWQSNAAVRVVRNAGVPGTTSAQIVTRTTEDCFSYNPDSILLMEGTNDVGNSIAQSVTLQNDAAFINAAFGQGITPIILAIPPRGTSSSPQAGFATATKALNQAKAAQALAMGAIWIDIWTPLADPVNLWFANPAWTADGVHVTALGAKVESSTILAALQGYIRGFGAARAIISGENGNPIVNPLFSGGPTASSWSFFGVTTNKSTSVFTAAGVNGQYQRVSWGSNAAAGQAFLEQTGINVSQFQGHKVAFTGRINTSGLEASGSTVSVKLLWTSGTDNLDAYLGAFDALAVDGNGVFYSEQIVPAAATAAKIDIGYTAAGTTPVTVDVAEFSLIDLRQPPNIIGTRAQKTPRRISTVSASTTLTLDNDVVLVNAAGGPVTITLPSAENNLYYNTAFSSYGVGIAGAGLGYTIIKIDSSANAVTVAPTGSDTINGATSQTISSQYAGSRYTAAGNGLYITVP